VVMIRSIVLEKKIDYVKRTASDERREEKIE
jgi:hypothetical protein